MPSSILLYVIIVFIICGASLLDLPSPVGLVGQQASEIVLSQGPSTGMTGMGLHAWLS